MGERVLAALFEQFLLFSPFAAAEKTRFEEKQAENAEKTKEKNVLLFLKKIDENCNWFYYAICKLLFNWFYYVFQFV